MLAQFSVQVAEVVIPNTRFFLKTPPAERHSSVGFSRSADFVDDMLSLHQIRNAAFPEVIVTISGKATRWNTTRCRYAVIALRGLEAFLSHAIILPP